MFVSHVCLPVATTIILLYSLKLLLNFWKKYILEVKKCFLLSMLQSNPKILSYLIWRVCCACGFENRGILRKKTEACGWGRSSPEWKSLVGVFGDEAREVRVRQFGGRTLRQRLPIRKWREKTVMDEGKEDMKVNQKESKSLDLFVCSSFVVR